MHLTDSDWATCPPLNQSLGSRGLGCSDWCRPGSPVPSLELGPGGGLIQPLRPHMGERWIPEPLFLDMGRMAAGTGTWPSQGHRLGGPQVRGSHFEISCYTSTRSFPLNFQSHVCKSKSTWRCTLSRALESCILPVPYFLRVVWPLPTEGPVVPTELVNAFQSVRRKSWLAAGLTASLASHTVSSSVVNIHEAGTGLLAELNFWQA